MLFRIFKYLLYTLTILVIAVTLLLLIPPLYRRMVTYPALERELGQFRAKRKQVANNSDLKVFRGVMHVHSYLSHDSRGTLTDLVPAARRDSIDFIFLTDHPGKNPDTIPSGYNGCYEGVLIIAGSEKQGFDTWPLKPAVIDWSGNSDTIARKVIENGGLIFFAHPEEPHNWGSRWYQGMEIYNFHADTKDERLLPLIVNFLINGNKYPQLSLREVFDEQNTILSRWDSLNTIRKIVGFSAVDTHENQNFRARFLGDGRLEWSGPDAKVIDTTTVGIWNRWLLRQPDQNGWVFKLMTDTYREGFNYITNYVFADSLKVSSLAANIRKGHLYTAFKGLGDAKGFNFWAEGQKDEICGIMGDSVSFSKIKTLRAVAPLPGKFRLLRNGKAIDSSAYDSYEYRWGEMIEKGAYRIEIHIMTGNHDVPWLYSNPVYIY